MSRYININDAIKLPMLGGNDYLMRSKGRFLTWSKYVWQDMNMQSVKIARREMFTINKRTRTIDLPCDFTQICSVNIMDDCGVFYPVYRNNSVKVDDIVDIPADKDCACEYKCGYKLCNLIKGYEAISSVKSDYLPNGTAIDFTCVDRKAIDDNGFLYEQIQYPIRQYLSGVWVDTILHTEDKKLCKVEVDENGCCCDSEANIESVCNSCGIAGNDYQPPVGGTSMIPPNGNTDTWIYYCNSKLDWFSVQCGCYPNGIKKECNNIYNITELGDRLIFPHDFGHDKVMVRFYADVNLNNLEIPMVALDTFIMGLKWWDARFDDKKQNLAQVYGRQYALMKFGLLRELNKYRIEELGKILTPPKYIPSNTLTAPNNFITGYTGGIANNDLLP